MSASLQTRPNCCVAAKCREGPQADQGVGSSEEQSSSVKVGMSATGQLLISAGRPTGEMISSVLERLGGERCRRPIVTAYRSVSDPEKFAAYARLAGPAISAAGGKFIVRGSPIRTFEAGLDQRGVVVEFENISAALAAYESEGYRAALGDGAERDVRLFEGA